jgi:hypothetical protein
MTNLPTSLSKACASGWPTWQVYPCYPSYFPSPALEGFQENARPNRFGRRSIRGGNQQTPTCTIRLAAELKSQALKMNLVADPAFIITKARDVYFGAASNIFSDM